MSFDWRHKSLSELEPHFNPRVAVGEEKALDYLARYAAQSAAARESLSGELDVRYGAAPKQTLDVFPAQDGALGTPAPVQIYLHGGYWRALDKSDHSFLAPAAVAAGFCQVHLNYDLCPSVTLDDIVREVREGLRFVHAHARDWGADPERILLVGHSAGAHLGAMLLNHDWQGEGLPARPVHAALFLSGIYEPEVVMRIPVNDEVQLDRGMAERNDCVRQPPRFKLPLLAVAGALEPEGWIQQTRDYAAACERAGLTTAYLLLPQADHFSMLADLADRNGTLMQEAVRLVQQ